MPTLLAINVSPRVENSVSRKLTIRFVEHWKAAHPDGVTIMRDLVETPPPFIDLSWIGGAFTPSEQHSPDMREAMRVSDEFIAELMAADHILIGTPMFNFSIPAALKAYIDQVVRVGVTVTPQYEGALRGKKATVILVSGSSFAIGPSCNSASTYLQQILGFMGIADVAVVLAGGTLKVDTGRTTFADFAAQFDAPLSDAAKADFVAR